MSLVLLLYQGAGSAPPSPPPPTIAYDFTYPVLSQTPPGFTQNATIVPGYTVRLPRVFLQGGAAANLTAGRVLFLLKYFETDPDAQAIATLDNLALGGVTVSPSAFGRAEIVVPPSATARVPTFITVLFYEIWLHDSAGNDWRTEQGQFVIVRL